MIRQAIIAMAAALLSAPALAQDWAAKASAADKAGDDVRAAIYGEKAVAQDPASLDNLLALANSYANLDLYEKVEATATSLLGAAQSQKDEGMQKQALQMRAHARYKMGLLSEAEADVALGRRMDPDQDYIDYVDILIAQRRGQDDLALAKAESALEKYTSYDSQYFPILKVATNLQVKAGRADKAEDFLRKALEQQPFYRYAEILVDVLVKTGRRSQAVAEAARWNLRASLASGLLDSIPDGVMMQMRAIERNPTANTRRWADLSYGWTLFRQAHYAEAARKFHSARQAYRSVTYCINMEATCYACMHDPARAAALADMALAIDTSYFDAEFFRADAAIEMGDRSTALSILEKRNNRFGKKGTLCQLLVAIGDAGLARQWLPAIEQSIAYEEGSISSMSDYAVLLEMVGEHDNAVATARKTIDMVKRYHADEPLDNVEIISCIELCALAAPDDPVANEAATRFASSATAYSGVLRASAVLRACQGRTDEALALLDSALRRGTLVSLARNHPLLAAVRSTPAFASLIAPYEQMVAKSAAPEWRTTSSVAYKGSESSMTIKVEVDGVPMDVFVDYKAQDGGNPTIGASDYGFLVKNGHADFAGGDRGTIKGLKIAGTLIGDVSVDIVSGSQKLSLTRSTLAILGRMQIDKAAKTLKFDNTL